MQDMHEVYGGGQLDRFVWDYWAKALPGDDAQDIQRQQLKTYPEQVVPTFR